MILQIVDKEFAICKTETLPTDFLLKDFTFVSKTDKELSILCETKEIPPNPLTVEDGWYCFRIAEDASFEKYGMIAFLAEIIAEQKTSTLVVGTYDTDYLFVKKDRFPVVIQALKEHGCSFL
ncbi:MAG: ACT domain-containing protein [Blautia sp.]|jgi:hypothetical protein